MPPTNAQAHMAADPTLFEPQQAWRPAGPAPPAQQGAQTLQQPLQPQLGWPPGAPQPGGAPPQLPPDVQQQLAQWYWWTQYASFCQGAAAAAATGQAMPFVATPRAQDATPGFPQGACFPPFFPFHAPHHGPTGQGGDGSHGGVSRPVAVRAFSGMHASGISSVQAHAREEPSRKRADPPARGRRRRYTPENRLCVNCGTTQTPFWRKHKSGGALCNACGLYMAKNDAPRPRLLWSNRAEAGAMAPGAGSDVQEGTCGSPDDSSVGHVDQEDSPQQVVTPEAATQAPQEAVSDHTQGRSE